MFDHLASLVLCDTFAVNRFLNPGLPGPMTVLWIRKLDIRLTVKTKKLNFTILEYEKFEMDIKREHKKDLGGFSSPMGAGWTSHHQTHQLR